MRIFAAKPSVARLVVFLAAALPRLVVLLYERGAILRSYVEKSDIFARTFVHHGTYGFAPGIPSAYTQPLYGWFLIPLYWVSRTWSVVGLGQIAVACATALVVHRIGVLVLGPRAGLIAAVLATLNPYLIWHDMHVNREIVDQLCAAALFLLVLLAARAGGWALGAAAGVAAGVAILGNSRLAALPLLLCAYVLWNGRDAARAIAVGSLLVVAMLVIAPWVVRNRIQVGCFTITTDAHALWKANNINTLSTLRRGAWIDDVPRLAGAPTRTPEYEYYIYRAGRPVPHIDECAQERLYTHATITFWKKHPVEKAKLMLQATRTLWQPQQTRTEGGPATGGGLRAWIEAVWALPVFLLALRGLFVAGSRFVALALIFLVYETLEAWLFTGATRYRVSFDFVLALLAAAAIDRFLSSSRYTASTPSTAFSAENSDNAR